MASGKDLPLDRTHDPDASSWVPSANVFRAEFPIQNLPLGVFTGRRSPEPAIGVAIGDQVLSLREAEAAGLLDRLDTVLREACRAPVLNPLMRLGRPASVALRGRVHELLRDGEAGGDRETVTACLCGVDTVTMRLPAEIGDYTDFYASIHHATNVGRMMRPDQPLLPNYVWVPIEYTGRASSIVPSGTAVVRPSGQYRPEGAHAPSFGPSQRLDYEIEVGAFIGPGNPLGSPVPLESAEEQLFGICLLNDWSARDVQGWEYQPLGPFLGKNFATTVSPWVVTREALRPYRVPRAPRTGEAPEPLPYLDGAGDRQLGGISLEVEVWLSTERMRAQGLAPAKLSGGSFSDMYWSFAQMITHHTSGGCNLRTGDLLASGTVSGSERSARGSLLELTWRGHEPIALPRGEVRRFLEDGDEVVMRGRAVAPGHRGVGLGECRGRIAPTRAPRS